MTHPASVGAIFKVVASRAIMSVPVLAEAACEEIA
jgi:hypothetical protein